MELLSEPIILRDGETLECRDLEVAFDFPAGSQNAVIQVLGDGVTIRDVRLFGPRDWPAVWVRPNMMGIRAENRVDLTVERVHIEGMPRAGFAGHGLTRLRMRDFSARHVFVGVNLNPTAPSFNCLFERVRVWDTWSDDVRYPSRVRPGGFVGGDGMAMNSLRSSILSECVMSGELFASYKTTNPQGLIVKACRGTSYMVQGVPAPPLGNGFSPARDVLLEDCIFDQGLGYDTESAGAVHLTLKIDGCRLHRCILVGAGRNGHGLKLTHEAVGIVVECCTINGFNGVEGKYAAHACDYVKSQGCSLNEDFALVNSFIDQQRILLVR